MCKLLLILLGLCVLHMGLAFPADESVVVPHQEHQSELPADITVVPQQEGQPEDPADSEEDLVEDDDDFLDDEEERAFWNSVIGKFGKALNLFKKAISFNPLTCNGASCSSCIRAKIINQEGCFTVSYNRQTGAKARLNIQLSIAGKQVFNGGVNAGKSVPSCANIRAPIKQVCLQDFWVNVPNGRDGSVCFTISFRTYGVGVKFCNDFRNGNLKPSVHPQIVKT